MFDAREVLDRFRARFPNLVGIADSRVLATASIMLELAEVLRLTTADEIADVLGLRFELTDEQMGSSFCNGVLRLVLSIQSWPLAQRIAFLRRHLIGRTVNSADDELGRAIFGDG